MHRAFALPALAACSFQGPLTTDAAALHDGAPVIDGHVTTCLEKWQQHTVQLGPELPLTTINTSTTDRDVFVTLDETQLYLSHANPDPDIVVATRAITTTTFGAPTLTTISSPDNEGKLSLTGDGMFAAISALELPASQFNVVLYQRSSVTDFTRKGVIAVAATSDHNDYDPYITPDGLRLYWAPVTVGLNDQVITLASRPDLATTFSVDRVLTELGSPASDPAPSYDETVLLYSKQTDGGSIQYATRATASGPFTPVGPVPTINTAGNEADPHLSKDACHVYFARFSPTTDWDLYVAPVL